MGHLGGRDFPRDASVPGGVGSGWPAPRRVSYSPRTGLGARAARGDPTLASPLLGAGLGPARAVW